MGRGGDGIYLPGNAVRALRALGFDQAVSERGVVIPRQRVSDHRGRLLVEVDVAELWHGIGPCLALARADLHAVLLDGARDVSVRMDADVRGLRELDRAVGRPKPGPARVRPKDLPVDYRPLLEEA